MERKNNKFKSLAIALGWLLIIVSTILFIKKESWKNKLNETDKNTEIIEFTSIDENLYIGTKIWGVSGNHYRIWFSCQENNFPDEENDLIFYQLELFYKQSGKDSLIIYSPRHVKDRIAYKELGKVKVKIVQISPIHSPEKKEELYNLGFKKVSVYNVK